MAESEQVEKEPQPGQTVRTQLWRRLVSVTQGVASYLKTGGSQLIHLKDPRGKKLGELQYHVVAPMGRFIYNKLNEARAMRRALRNSEAKVDSVIIRTDTTSEGFIASEREVK